jgi:ElaB/YqjD/DUF883 family membrane-anchored ribosome-binding protein
MNNKETHETGTVENLANAAGERVKGYVDSGVSACNAMSERTRQIGQNASGYVRDNPWIAIGVAAGLGAAVGFLLGRRCDS